MVEREQPIGVVVQLGGQTPLKLAHGLEAAGVRILGTSPDAIDLAEDRRRFGALLREEGIRQPEHGSATSLAEARAAAEAIGYPVMVRPSYVLGGRAMRICHDEATLVGYMNDAAEVSAGHPVLLDRFLEDAVEVDLDLLCDGKRAVVCGILQHIEEAGIHSGDSAAVLPPYSVSPANLDAMRDIALRLAVRLGVVGLMNVQFAVRRGEVFVLEVNPRASRTVPFIAKAVGVPLVALASQLMVGKTLEEIGFTEEPAVPAVFVKAPVFPFNRFPGVDPVLGPEMKSTGEVMGWSPRASGRRSPRRCSAPACDCRRRAPRSSRCTIATSRACCRWRAGSPSWASTCWRPGAPPSTCRSAACRCAPSTRCTRRGRTWATT